MTEGHTYWSPRGREYRLGPPVEGAGDGVFSVPLSHEIVAVIHHDGSDPALRERKVEAMLKKPPALPDIVEDGQRFVRMDWPLATLHDRSRKFAGYLRPALDLQATSPLEYVLRERKARVEGLPTSLGAKINLAARLAVAITELHQLDHHVVYLSPANLRFYRQSLHLALMGCEHFSIRASLERFAAQPGAGGINSHYLAPEFQGQPIPVGKEESQDRFALAVIVFQLLNFGIHPFDGLPTRDDLPYDIPGRIARNCYAYGPTPHPDLEPDPDSGLLAMPKEFQELFHRAFENHGGPRPPALDWATWLQFYSIPSNNRVVVCSANPTHHHYAELPCAACARDPLPPAPPSEPEPPDNRARFAPVETNEPPFVPIEHAFPLGNRFPPAKRPVLPALRLAALRRLSFPQTLGLLAVLFLGIAYMATRTPQPDTSEPASVPKPADAPAAPAMDPYLAGNPDLQQSEALTEGYVTAAARAITTDDRTEWQRAITNLRTDVPAHAPAPPSEFQAAFVQYSAGLSSDRFDAGKLQRLLKGLRQVLRQNPYDDETAYELGWLSLVSGKREDARNFFLHAIWLNPDRAHAWYGLGIIGADDNQRTGALVTAELLTPDPAQAESMRKAFPPLLLQLSSLKPDHFAARLAIARRLAEHYRPLVASPKYE
jgi:hypothetical protein